ncbi:hypothetical protein CVT25_000779, partial [Psilocybe cyanescens]
QVAWHANARKHASTQPATHISVCPIKTIFEALKEEYEPDDQSSITADIPPNSSLRTLRRMQLRFSPLFLIESNLLKILSPGCSDSRNMAVRAGNEWKTLLKTKQEPFSSGDNSSTGRLSESILGQDIDPSWVLVGLRNNIISLWQNPETQEILNRRRPLFRDQPEFFMDDIARIIAFDYVPSDRFDRNTDFYIAVGESRSQRASWAPFFHDVQVILFLASLDFNQMPDEDHRVNGQKDSLRLWKDICGNRLLEDVKLILFFKKRDVLTATLAAGFQKRQFVPANGDLPNDVPHATKYVKEKFRIYHKKYSPISRPFHCHEVSVLEMKAVWVFLSGVRQIILQQYLRDAEMI